VRFNGDAGSLVIHGTAYYLRQMHWHSPTEHTVDGRRSESSSSSSLAVEELIIKP